jgi:general secretion pathway protein J
MNRSATRTRPSTRQAGFTLIEMLVAIALLAVVAVLSWRGLDATIRARSDLVASLSQTRTLGRYFSQLQYDMLNLVAPNEVDGPPLRIMPDELVLVRHLDIGSRPARLQVVRYRLKDHRLLRSASQPLATVSDLSTALHHMDDFAAVVASDDVRSMDLAVWLPPDGWTSRQSVIADAYGRFLTQYAVSTIGTLQLPLPTGIRFSITLSSPPMTFTRLIPLGE